MHNKSQTFIFIGRSGSGKGTQIKLLEEYLSDKNFKIKSVVMGDIFRSFFKESGMVRAE